MKTRGDDVRKKNEATLTNNSTFVKQAKGHPCICLRTGITCPITGCSIANLAKFRSNRTLRTNRREVGDFGVLGPEIENADRDLHFGLIIFSKQKSNN